MKLKKDYNDAGCGPSSGRPPAQRLLSGDAWYNQQAFRALNQVGGQGPGRKRLVGGLINETADEETVSRAAGGGWGRRGVGAGSTVPLFLKLLRLKTYFTSGFRWFDRLGLDV